MTNPADISSRTGRIQSLTICVAIAVAVVTVTAWLVPLSPVPNMYGAKYYLASMFAFGKWMPRAIMGSLADLLGLSPFGFMLMLQGVAVAWISLVLLLIDNALNREANERPAQWARVGVLAALGVLIGYAQGAMWCNIAGYLDTAIYLLATMALALLSPTAGWSRIAASAIILLLAVAVHELAVILAAMVIVYAWCVLPLRRFLVYATVVTAGSSALLLSWLDAPRVASPGKSVVGYLQEAGDFVINPHGIIHAGGLLWIIFALSAFRTLRGDNPFLSHPAKRILFMAAMVVATFSGAVVAGDTDRIILPWLPCLIMLLLSDTWSLVHFRPRSAVCVLLLLSALHLVIPPQGSVMARGGLAMSYRGAVSQLPWPLGFSDKTQAVKLGPLYFAALGEGTFAHRIERPYGFIRDYPLDPHRLAPHAPWPGAPLTYTTQ